MTPEEIRLIFTAMQYGSEAQKFTIIIALLITGMFLMGLGIGLWAAKAQILHHYKLTRIERRKTKNASK